MCGGRVVDIHRSVQHFLNCGEVGSSHSGSYQPMRRALSHLRVTGDSSRVAPAPCILCRSPWGSGPESVSELQHLCASLQVSGLPHGDCVCVACRADRDARHRSDMGSDAPQPFTHHYRTDRAAVARAAFNELVTRARLADDAQAVVSAYTWSAILVPFIWSAAADEAALRPIRGWSLPSWWDQWYLYPDEYVLVKPDSFLPDSFLPGRPLKGCFCSASLKKASSHCESPTVCGGITAVGLPFQFRCDTKLSPLRLGICFWVRCCGSGFAWCNKDGVNYCSDSQTQPIPQTCWSWWPYGSLSFILGNFMFQDLSFLDCAVPVHSLVPPRILEQHCTRVSSAAGQSLVPGVDTPQGPVDGGLASRPEEMLRPIQERHLLSRPDQRNSCSVGYGVETPYSFCAGCLYSGLRAQHLFEAVCGVEQDAALHALETAVNNLASKGPRSLSMHLSGASLVALAEENGDVWPIAAGIVWRLFPSTCLRSAVRSAAQRFFGSLKVGVACPLDLGATIRTISHYRERNAASMAQIVVTNAFNSLDKNALLTACWRDFPTRRMGPLVLQWSVSAFV